MNTFRIELFFAGHAKQRAQDLAAGFGGAGHTGDPEMISAAGYFYIESAFDLS